MKFDQSDIKRGYPRFRLFSYRNDRFVSPEPLNALMIQLEIVTSTENRSLEWHVIYEIASFQNNSNVSRSRDRCSIMNFHRWYHWRSSHSWKRANLWKFIIPRSRTSFFYLFDRTCPSRPCNKFSVKIHRLSNRAITRKRKRNLSLPLKRANSGKPCWSFGWLSKQLYKRQKKKKERRMFGIHRAAVVRHVNCK